jgi:hypothetical protein
VRAKAAVCAGLLLWSLIPLAAIAWQVLRHGGVVSGSDGWLAGSDQQLYLAFIRDAGSDVLISNEYRLGDSQGAFLHPMWLVSGGLWQLGLDLRAALLLWKPVAVAALAAGVWLYAGRFLAGRERLAAVAVALFFFSPLAPLLIWGGADLDPVDHLVLLFTSGESMPALQTWGYFHAALSIGLMALFLVGVERLLAGGARPRLLAALCACGAFTAWVHPWKGATLLAILGGLAAWGRLAPRYRVLAIPAAAIVAPMAYLWLLPKIDDDWRVYAPANEAVHAPWWILAGVLLPLALPALAGAGRAARDDAGRILLLWPPAALAVYFATTQFPYHALQGVTIPLAVLAAYGLRRVRLPAWAVVAGVVVLTLPGAAFAVDQFRSSKRSGVAPYVLDPGEDAALRYLEDAPAGGVLARYYLGMTVPPRTGHDTWLGQFPWTPDFEERRAQAERLFGGALDAAAAQRMVRAIGPRYVLADCRQPFDVAPLLGDLVASTRTFGCARVHELR